MSALISARMALLTIRLGTSPIPIGLTTGHLSRAINLQAVRGFIGSGSTKDEQILLTVPARASHKLQKAL